MPQYVLLLHDRGAFPSDISPEEIQAIIQRYVAWREKVSQGGRAVDGHKLRDGEGRVLRGRPGAPTVTDGPFAEAREVIGGLFVIEAASYDEAVALCGDCPHLDFGTIEIREVEPTGAP
ncbi:MAG: YciI family protein [Vicinamibacterales bacterium]